MIYIHRSTETDALAERIGGRVFVDLNEPIRASRGFRTMYKPQ